MFDVQALKEAQEMKKKYKENFLEKAKELEEKAISELVLFHENKDINVLKNSGELLLESLKYNKDSIKSNVYMAYIFYLLGENTFSVKYIKESEQIDPSYPDLIKIKKLILEQN